MTPSSRTHTPRLTGVGGDGGEGGEGGEGGVSLHWASQVSFVSEPVSPGCASRHSFFSLSHRKSPQSNREYCAGHCHLSAANAPVRSALHLRCALCTKKACLTETACQSRQSPRTGPPGCRQNTLPAPSTSHTWHHRCNHCSLRGHCRRPWSCSAKQAVGAQQPGRRRRVQTTSA